MNEIYIGNDPGSPPETICDRCEKCLAGECDRRPCAHNSAPRPGKAAPRKFDEAAFDEAVSKPSGWSDVADPVAEIRRMRDGDAPGNAAAIRDALLYARNTLVLYSRDMKPRYQAEVGFMIDKCDAALAAPARNCDRFADATEMVRAFLKDPYSTQGRDSLVEVSHRFAEWAFAPAEGGDHA